MSYLGATRLHFAGQFQANVSTVNNDAYHFNNAAFQAAWQHMQGKGMNPPNGWFNPQGDGAWRLLGCSVTSAHLPSGAVAAGDPVLACIVADSDDQAPAKIVDLDPEQQLVSQIWGLTVRIADCGGNTLMQGDFEPCAFFDIWDRGLAGGGGDTNAGACWQSVLSNLKWGDVSGSAFLTELQAMAANGILSIKFNVDGINMKFGSPDFMCGRLVGTIGAYFNHEPSHLVVGRHFMARASAGGNFFAPRGYLNFLCGRVDREASGIFLDLGNALPTTIAGGPIADVGDLTLAILDPQGGIRRLAMLKPDIYADPTWYADTAGVVFFPLDVDALGAADANVLALCDLMQGVLISESPSTAYLRADSFVLRLSPGEAASVAIYAMQYGKPLAGTEVTLAIDNGQLQPTPAQPPFAGASPPVGEPVAAVSIPSSATTDAAGVARLAFTAGDPGNARWFNGGADYGIDGQVYGVRPAFAEAALAVGPVNQWDFVSFLIWSGWSPANTPPTWSDVAPIFQQYANLYPVMSRFLDLGDEASVRGHAWLLKLSFGLPMSNPNHMPVTRDLSSAKRDAIIAFLDTVEKGEAGGEALPRPSAKAPVSPPTDVGQPLAATDSGAAPDVSKFSKGGKAAAAARRLILQDR